MARDCAVRLPFCAIHELGSGRLHPIVPAVPQGRPGQDRDADPEACPGITAAPMSTAARRTRRAHTSEPRVILTTSHSSPVARGPGCRGRDAAGCRSSVGLAMLAYRNEEETMTERAPLPYAFAPKVPSFTVESDDVSDGTQMGDAQVYSGFGMTGQNVSPHLRWHGFPEEAKGFAVTCYDPDAPTGSGFWHWLVIDIPADRDAACGRTPGSDAGALPIGAFSVRNDYGSKDFGGAAARTRR